MEKLELEKLYKNAESLRKNDGSTSDFNDRFYLVSKLNASRTNSESIHWMDQFEDFGYAFVTEIKAIAKAFEINEPWEQEMLYLKTGYLQDWYRKWTQLTNAYTE